MNELKDSAINLVWFLCIFSIFWGWAVGDSWHSWGLRGKIINVGLTIVLIWVLNVVVTWLFQ